MSNPRVTINLVVYNGGKYIRQCLDSVLGQSYSHELIEINILDNNSTDSTREIIKSWRLAIGDWRLPKLTFVESKVNLGMWPGQEFLLGHSHGEYVVALSVDIVLHPDFIKNTIETMEKDSAIGALQAKVYKYDFPFILNTRYEILDTLGFKIFKSRRIINIGHGETQLPTTNYQLPTEIFAVEGAVPVFRRQALEDCRLESQGQDSRGSTSGASSRLNLGEGSRSDLGKGLIIDPDFFWYGDDLDLAWRMRLFGWKQVYTPNVIAWHDRKTTKALAGGWKEFIEIRKTVPMFKRRLDWRNTTLAIIKNDFAVNLLRDLPYILWRQLRLWAYFLLFEPAMFLEIFKVAKLLPRMLKRRSEVMKKARISAKEIHYWFK